jgi:retron-type reverse transcriptase
MPKTFGNLYPQVYDFQNLLKASHMAARGKREMPEALRFEENLEENLIILQNELLWYTWTPRPYRRFIVNEPKRREIAAPDFRDRVIHHALVQIIEPLFDRKMINTSFACRAGMGTHKGILKASQFIKECHAKFGNFYILKGDVSKYFYSVDHSVLKKIIRRTIRCRDTLWLLDRIIGNGTEDEVGLPIGALTSQLFANVYLDQLDHFVKEILREYYYLRYMDDFVVLRPEKTSLRATEERIEEFLNQELRLRLNPKTSIYPWHHGLNFCGYRIWPTHTLPRKANVYRMQRRLRRMSRLCATGRLAIEHVQSVLMSWFGYMRHCNSYRTMSEFLNKFILKQGTTEGGKIHVQKHRPKRR